MDVMVYHFNLQKRYSVLFLCLFGIAIIEKRNLKQKKMKSESVYHEEKQWNKSFSHKCQTSKKIFAHSVEKNSV